MSVTAIARADGGVYVGLSSDTKPTDGVKVLARFFEVDEGLWYTFDGASWALDPGEPVYLAARGWEDTANGVARIEEQHDLDFCAASATTTLFGSGAVGDYLRHLLIIPTNASPDAITLADGNGTARTILPASSALDDFKPIYVPIFATCKNATTPGWKVVVGANATVLAVGRASA